MAHQLRCDLPAGYWSKRIFADDRAGCGTVCGWRLRRPLGWRDFGHCRRGTNRSVAWSSGHIVGRNTIGGAISVVTRQPEIGGDVQGSIGASVGNDSLLNLNASIEGTLSDTAAARFNGALFNQDGYVQRADGIDLGDDDTLTARLAVNWQPSDALSGQISVDMTRDRENGPAMQLIGIDFTDLSQLAGVVALHLRPWPLFIT